MKKSEGFVGAFVDALLFPGLDGRPLSLAASKR